MSLVKCWYHYFLDRQACNNYAAYLFLAHIGSILTTSGFQAGCHPPRKIEQPALIYLSQLLATANDAKKLGDLQVKSSAKISLGDLYEITGQISETKQLISRGLTQWARKNLTILK
jgi:hypothetical protein